MAELLLVSSGKSPENAKFRRSWQHSGKSILLVPKCVLALRRAGRWHRDDLHGGQPELGLLGPLVATPSSPRTHKAEAERETEDEDGLGHLACGEQEASHSHGAGSSPGLPGGGLPAPVGRFQRPPEDLLPPV